MQLELSASMFDAVCKAFQAGRVAEAEDLCRRILIINPAHAEALCALGVIAAQAHRPEDALRLFDQAIAAAPGFADAHANRGGALRELNRMSEASEAFRRSLELNPGQIVAHYGLGNCLVSQGDFDGAARAFQQALRFHPNFLDAQINLAMALEQQGLPAEAVVALRRALELKPDQVLVHSNLLLLLTYLPGSPEGLVEAHRDFERRQAQGLQAPGGSHANVADPERRLRVGYVSADFSLHPVGYLLAGPLAAHDPAQVEVFCYVASAHQDAMTERLKSSAHHWRPIHGLADSAAADLIRQDKIDILVDLSGHTGQGRPLLMARKPAPVQVSWLGYPGTTGLKAVDYAIMDRHTAPEGAEAWFTEALVRLPFNRFCFTPPAFAPEPHTASGRRDVVFGSFNNMAKIGPDVVRLWARVLMAVSGSRLVLKWKVLDQPEARARIETAFAEHGVGPDRLELRGRSDHAEALAQYDDIDVALDPFPFSGGITSLEALWMGVPVVTLAQDRVAGRQSLGFLAQVGLEDLAADTEDDYVRIAASLAADPARRAELRAGLRGRMAASPLTRAEVFTPGLEQAYREMWRRWCEGLPPEKMDIG